MFAACLKWTRGGFRYSNLFPTRTVESKLLSETTIRLNVEGTHLNRSDILRSLLTLKLILEELRRFASMKSSTCKRTLNHSCLAVEAVVSKIVRHHKVVWEGGSPTKRAVEQKKTMGGNRTTRATSTQNKPSIHRQRSCSRAEKPVGIRRKRQQHPGRRVRSLGRLAVVTAIFYLSVTIVETEWFV